MLSLKHAKMLVPMTPADYREKSELKDVAKIGLFMGSDPMTTVILICACKFSFCPLWIIAATCLSISPKHLISSVNIFNIALT